MKKRWMKPLAAAFFTLFVHDLMLIAACLMIQGTVTAEGMYALIRDRLTVPGDAVRYLQIAREGYVKSGADAINLVFYPLYPLLMRIFSFGFFDLAAVGMVLSRLSLMGAAVCLYELVKMDRGEKDAVFSVCMMAVYPFSMFTVGVYTESLFLLLTIGCMLLIRKDRMVMAGIVGFLAALTRVQGMLLIFPAVYRIVAGRLGKEERKISAWDAAVLLIPAGFAVYLIINYVLHGNAFQFLVYEEGEPWYQSTRWVGENIAQQYRNAMDFQGLDFIIYWPQILLYFLGVVILFYGIREKVRMEYLLYGAVYLGFTYLSGWMISGGRYMLCCFPLFPVLSCIKSDKVRLAVLAAGGCFFFLYSYLFLLGYAIM